MWAEILSKVWWNQAVKLMIFMPSLDSLDFFSFVAALQTLFSHAL